MRFLDLFVVASMPVLKVLLLTALGSFLALDRIDVMGEDARKQLNNVSRRFSDFGCVSYIIFLIEQGLPCVMKTWK